MTLSPVFLSCCMYPSDNWVKTVPGVIWRNSAASSRLLYTSEGGGSFPKESAFLLFPYGTSLMDYPLAFSQLVLLSILWPPFVGEEMDPERIPTWPHGPSDPYVAEPRRKPRSFPLRVSHCFLPGEFTHVLSSAFPSPYCPLSPPPQTSLSLRSESQYFVSVPATPGHSLTNA